MIVLINPNSTVAMTESMLSTARAVAPELHIEGWTSHDGPPAIQGYEDGELAEAPLLELVDKASDAGAHCIIIACFDDTALAEAKKRARCPVIGIGHAAYHLAAVAGERFAVVTTLDVSVPILKQNIEDYGLGHAACAVVASGVPVLDLEEHPDAAMRKIAATIRELIAQEAPDTIVLGCGGMVDIDTLACHGVDVRLIDGVRAAAHVARALV